MNIAIENRHNAGILAEQVREETAHVLKQWGCDAPCVDKCTADMEVFETGMCNTCKCPTPITVKHTPNAALPPSQAAVIIKAMQPEGSASLTCEVGNLCDA